MGKSNSTIKVMDYLVDFIVAFSQVSIVPNDIPLVSNFLEVVIKSVLLKNGAMQVIPTASIGRIMSKAPKTLNS